jgi:serralysin
MAAFATQRISYTQYADDPYAWDVRYDLSSYDDRISVALFVDLVGVAPGAAIESAWRRGVDEAWNCRVFFDDGAQLLPVDLKFDFVDTGAHQTVNVLAGTGRGDMTTWYLTTEWGEAYRDEFAAHEVGHMLGAFDEYAGGATYGGYTTTGTLMSDLTLAGFANYFWSIEYFTEAYGYRFHTDLETVLAIRGNGSANTLIGGAGREGFYGFGGVDLIRAGGGNDYLDGGGAGDDLRGGPGDDRIFGQAGGDRLAGGLGSDRMNGGTGSDRFLFNTTLGPTNVDTIAGFAVGVDRILLDDAIFGRLTPDSEPLRAVFFRRTAPLDANDHIIYEPTSGALIYDTNGNGAGGATRFAILGTGLALTHNDIFVV